MERRELLRNTTFGARIAEEETARLARYFVETDQWHRIYRGEIDVIKGDKGTGKSAIYSLLIAKSSEFFDRGVLLVAAEKPQGTPVFKELTTDPPTKEREFIHLWKLYIVTIIIETAHDYGISNSYIDDVRTRLIDQGFIEDTLDLSRLLRRALNYVRRWVDPKQLGTQFSIDPTTGAPNLSVTIAPSEPNDSDKAKGVVSIDRLVESVERGLAQANFEVWVLLDRLDVAFAETHNLEKNALRALFRVYMDFGGLTKIKLKIFIRSDIWEDIVDEGFREASHITKDIVIGWSQSALLNLIIRRIVDNKSICVEFNIEKNSVLNNFEEQIELFYKLVPKQIDQGSRKPPTLDWILSRCADGTGKTAPREVIHLLNTLREEEVKRLEQGNPVPQENRLFDRSVFKAALPAVSTARLIQTIYAEYPEKKPFLAKLEGEKTEQTLSSLAEIWGGQSQADAQALAEDLVRIGFFQRKGSREEPTFWVPFLYRDALKMSQGKAGDANRPDDDLDE